MVVVVMMLLLLLLLLPLLLRLADVVVLNTSNKNESYQIKKGLRAIASNPQPNLLTVTPGG